MKSKKILFALSIMGLSLSGCSIFNPSTSSLVPSQSERSGEHSVHSGDDSTISSSNSEDTSSSEKRPTYRKNPFIELNMPDPCIIRSDEDKCFYVFSTQGTEDYENDGHKFTSYIPIMKSKDLVQYEYVGSVLKGVPSWCHSDVEGIWAPDVIKYDGLYYCYYTAGVWNGDTVHDGIGVATAKRLDGEWTDHGKVICGTDEGIGTFWPGSCMDQCVVEYNDSLYMFFGSFGGIYYIPLSEDGFSVKSRAKATLVIGGYKGTTRSDDFEGAFIRKMNGHWYFTGSHGSCCKGEDSTYSLRTLVSTTNTPFGPYVYYDNNGNEKAGLKCKGAAGNLMLGGYTNGDSGTKIGNVAGPGHHAVFQDDNDDWWVLYHGYVRDARSEGYNTGRIIFYDKLEWDDSYPIDMPYVDGVKKYASSFDYEVTKCEIPYLI